MSGWPSVGSDPVDGRLHAHTSRLPARTRMIADTPSSPDPAATRSGLAITWLGHATVLIEMDGVRVLTDPVLRHRIGPLVRIVPEPETVGTVDCVLLSHLHADHTDLRSLRDVDSAGPIVAPHPGRDWLSKHGLANVVDLRVGERIAVGELIVTATPATHDRRRRPFGPQADPVGHVVQGSRSVYFAGDTGLFLAMAELRGTIDVALLPIWGWGSHVGAGHLDPGGAAAAASLIAPSITIPIHWGTFALIRPARRSSDPRRPAREFAALATRYAPAVEVRTLAPGERIVL
jgi:L-ascorbate metabolism protein UlaG (beta-lactamase superfamily)